MSICAKIDDCAFNKILAICIATSLLIPTLSSCHGQKLAKFGPHQMGGVSLAALQLVCSASDWYIGVFPVEMLLGECHWDPIDDEAPLVLVAWLHQVDGLVQERRNSSALAMEWRLSCSDYWDQCWPISVLLYGITVPHWDQDPPAVNLGAMWGWQTSVHTTQSLVWRAVCRPLQLEMIKTLDNTMFYNRFMYLCFTVFNWCWYFCHTFICFEAQL